MKALAARGATIAGRAQARAIDRTAGAIATALPGVAATPMGTGVALSGRGLRRRLADDAALRWIGSLLR